MKNELRTCSRNHTFFALFYTVIVIAMSMYTTFLIISHVDQTKISVGSTTIIMNDFWKKYHSIVEEIKGFTKKLDKNEHINPAILEKYKKDLLPLHLNIDTTANVDGNITAKGYGNDVIKAIVSSITRIGIVLVPLYLIFILFSLIKYYVKMASFYKRLMIFVLLSDNNIDFIERYEKIYSTNSIDFSSNSPVVLKAKHVPKIIDIIEVKIDKIIEIFSK